jgi:heat shock protein 4
LTPDKLFAIEMVGGGSRLQPLQQFLEKSLNKKLSQTTNAEEAIAKGCALQVIFSLVSLIFHFKF